MQTKFDGEFMKRFFSIFLLVAVIATVFTGCGASADIETGLSVVCTVFPQYDFVRNIAKDKADIKMLVPLGTESHDFQLENLTVAELKTVSKADLVIYVGGESDLDWITELKTTVKGNASWMAMTDTVETLEEISSDSMEHIHDHTADHGGQHEHEGHTAYDEHVWTSPKRVVVIVKAITDELCRLDPENGEFYKANSEQYLKELQKLDNELAVACQSGTKNKLIFGDRFPFRYLCEDYGLEFDAAFSGCSSGVDLSVAQMTSLTKNAIESGAKVIFYMENSDPVFAESIAKTVGVKAELLHSCHTFSKEEILSGVSYVSVMSDNIKKISEALK